MDSPITDEMRKEWEEFIRLHPPYTWDEITSMGEREGDGNRKLARSLQDSLDDEAGIPRKHPYE